MEYPVDRTHAESPLQAPCVHSDRQSPCRSSSGSVFDQVVDDACIPNAVPPPIPWVKRGTRAHVAAGRV